MAERHHQLNKPLTEPDALPPAEPTPQPVYSGGTYYRSGDPTGIPFWRKLEFWCTVIPILVAMGGLLLKQHDSNRDVVELKEYVVNGHAERLAFEARSETDRVKLHADDQAMIAASDTKLGVSLKDVEKELHILSERITKLEAKIDKSFPEVRTSTIGGD
jgi:hypothetical protein